MSGKQHRYQVRVEWTGNSGSGTSTYRSYERAHELSAEGKPVIAASSDPVFRGDASRWNPEELLVAALSSCHQLSYLHFCSAAGIVVTAYSDDAEGFMDMAADGAGQFSRVVLRPRVTIAAGGDEAKAQALHHDAAKACFIARSVNFPVDHEPEVVSEAG